MAWELHLKIKTDFKQFYRVRNQQVTKTTGFGLGLTFVHKVVCAYGGKYI